MSDIVATVRRFTITPERRRDDQVTFDRRESHHLARVLRLKAGDTVVAVDGSGREFTVRLDTVAPEAAGTIVGVAARNMESSFAITLVQALPKGDKLEAVIRAATELGIARVAPALTTRTVVGPRLLRTETAGPAVIAALQFHYGDLGHARRNEDQGGPRHPSERA